MEFRFDLGFAGVEQFSPMEFSSTRFDLGEAISEQFSPVEFSSTRLPA